MTHNIRTGVWRKKKHTTKDHVSFLFNSTGPQRSFIHEIMHQQLTGQPTRMWGVPIPKELHQQASRGTLSYIMHAARKPAHEFGRLISEHREGSGIISNITHLVGKADKVIGSYVNNAKAWTVLHTPDIVHGVEAAHRAVENNQPGTTIRGLTGGLHSRRADRINHVSDYVHDRLQRSAASSPWKH